MDSEGCAGESSQRSHGQGSRSQDETGKGVVLGSGSGSDGQYAVLWRGCEVGPVSPDVGNMSLLGESSIPGSAGQKPNRFGFRTDRKQGKETDHIGSPFPKVFVK